MDMVGPTIIIRMKQRKRGEEERNPKQKFEVALVTIRQKEGPSPFFGKKVRKST